MTFVFSVLGAFTLRARVFSSTTSPPSELLFEMKPSDTILDLKTKIFLATGIIVSKLKVQQKGSSTAAKDGRTMWYYEFHTLGENGFVDAVRSDIPKCVRPNTF